ncbi:MAG: hypothetical protein GY694_03515 [Gammaproteobacteria bacterium]|nr:hypothetical protein [Gammaproteobacteria bacterium]
MNNESDSKNNNFSSAMGDLKGLLDKEGITSKLPTLNGTITVTDEDADESELDEYISDFEDDSIELSDFAGTVKELEQKVESITDSEELKKFAQSESTNVLIQNLKQTLHRKLKLQIETSIDELKNKLLLSIKKEIDNLFNTSSKK